MLITFEGTEGAGKSTLIQSLKKRLKKEGYTVLSTREPGGSTVAEKIRKIILDTPMNPWTELFLYEASRAEHLHQTILPALKKGMIVLCDRFTDSTLAYQGTARKLDWKTIHILNRIATQGLQPDLTIFIDIDPQKGLSRAKNPNRFEREGVSFQKKVRQGFLKAIQENPKRFIQLKAYSGTPDEMANQLWLQIKRKIKKKNDHSK